MAGQVSWVERLRAGSLARRGLLKYADNGTVVGDNESEIMKLIQTLPQETDKV